VVRRLDRSAVTSSVYSLCVTASDGPHSTSVDFNVTLYQSEDRRHQLLLEFSQPFYVFDVAEDMTPGVVVGRVEAFVGVVGHRSSSSWRLTYTVTSRWASSAFHLNVTHGILTLANSLDYETVCHCR